ncbi:MAG TPA: hypothetical protein DIT04_07120 [Dysgonomonas sp.]|nr:hypothetical protein [Dysgonomonas sp.]
MVAKLKFSSITCDLSGSFYRSFYIFMPRKLYTIDKKPDTFILKVKKKTIHTSIKYCSIPELNP